MAAVIFTKSFRSRPRRGRPYPCPSRPASTTGRSHRSRTTEWRVNPKDRNGPSGRGGCGLRVVDRPGRPPRHPDGTGATLPGSGCARTRHMHTRSGTAPKVYRVAADAGMADGRIPGHVFAAKVTPRLISRDG